MASGREFDGNDRRRRSRTGRNVGERRLDYWRQLERLGLRVVNEMAELVPDELLDHYEQLETQIVEHETYLDALRKTIEAEETGFREYENKYLERLERERKKRSQLKTRMQRDWADPEELARKVALAEEELEVLERRIAEEEVKATGELTEALRQLRLDRIRRQRRMEELRQELKGARRKDRIDQDPRLLQIDEQITQLEADLHSQEEAIDGRLADHQENLRVYSDRLATLRDQHRDHLIKIGDGVFHHNVAEEALQEAFERLRRMIREAVR